MDNDGSRIAEGACLCHGFVAKEDRIDFEAIRPNAKTGKPERKVILRYHKLCPDHGLNLVEKVK